MKKTFSFLVISFFVLTNNALAHEINVVHSHGESTFKAIFFFLIVVSVFVAGWKALKTEKK